MYNNSNITVMKATKKNQEAAVRNNAKETIVSERKSLFALTKQLREQFGKEERINILLCNYYKQLHNLPVLKTREQWEREGFKVNALGQSRFPAWGKPVSRVNKQTGEEYQFFPVTHFYVPEAVCQA